MPDTINATPLPSPFTPKEVKKFLKIFWWLGIVLVLFGVFQIYNLWTLDHSDFVQAKVTGQIADIRQVLNVSFQINNGQNVYLELSCYSLSEHNGKGQSAGFLSTSPVCQDYPVGSTIKLYYPRNNPSAAHFVRLDTQFILLFVSLTAGVILLVLQRGRQKQANSSL